MHGGPLLAPYGLLPAPPHAGNGADAGAYQQWAAIMYPHMQAMLAAQQAGLPRPPLSGPPASAGAPTPRLHPVRVAACRAAALVADTLKRVLMVSPHMQAARCAVDARR